MKATTEKLLQWCLLSEICQKSGDYFVFQQDGTPSYWAKSTVEFLQRIMTNFIEPSVCPPIARTWLTTLYGGALQQNMYRIPISNLDDLEDSAHLLGESWPTDHRQVYWSLAWLTEGCGSSEWRTHWTVVLIIWFICCHALFCSVCILRTCLHLTIMYWALLWYCDKK